MRITHLGHACLLVEMADTRLLIDPGTFADGLADVRDLDAVIVTHQHPDHLDPERLPGIAAASPEAVVLCDPGSVDVDDMTQLITDVIHAARARKISLGHDDAPAQSRRAIDEFVLSALERDGT